MHIPLVEKMNRNGNMDIHWIFPLIYEIICVSAYRYIEEVRIQIISAFAV